MATRKKPQPKLVQVGVTRSMGGKVAIRSYGNVTSEYFVSHTKSWSVPAGMTESEVDKFRAERDAELREEVDVLAQREHDERFEQSYLNED